MIGRILRLDNSAPLDACNLIIDVKISMRWEDLEKSWE